MRALTRGMWLAAGIWLASVAAAEADMTPMPGSYAVRASYPSDAVVGSSPLPFEDLHASFDLHDFAAVPQEPARDSNAVIHRSLPAAPSSASLFLSALVSLGAWQVVRSASHWSRAGLPGWYHTGAPMQIGTTVLFDFDFQYAIPVLHGEDSASPEASRSTDRHRLTDSYRPRSRSLEVAAPRGPPARSM